MLPTFSSIREHVYSKMFQRLARHLLAVAVVWCTLLCVYDLIPTHDGQQVSPGLGRGCMFVGASSSEILTKPKSVEKKHHRERIAESRTKHQDRKRNRDAERAERVATRHQRTAAKHMNRANMNANRHHRDL